MSDNKARDELRDKLKFGVLVPFVTRLDPLYKAEMLMEKNIAIEDATAYKLAVDETMQLIDAYTQSRVAEARIDEREGMQFFDDDGTETHKPYLQYRYTGDGLKLSWG
jgi:hypothetical protein